MPFSYHFFFFFFEFYEITVVSLQQRRNKKRFTVLYIPVCCSAARVGGGVHKEGVLGSLAGIFSPLLFPPDASQLHSLAYFYLSHPPALFSGLPGQITEVAGKG